MENIKILIVEDELIIAEDMKNMLQELGYEVTGIAKGCDEAENMLEHDPPDIALIDIKLRCNDDGIQLAVSVKEEYNIPVIFVTSNTDKATVERAKEAQPSGYIVKPFEKDDLYTSIEIALSNFLKLNSVSFEKAEDNYLFNEYLFVKKKYQFEKVKIIDIQWIRSEGNYLEIHCNNKKGYLIRSTFRELFQNIELKTLIQVHKSYAVNLEFVDSLNGNQIIIGKTDIPIGKVYQENLKKRLNLMF